MKNLEVWYAHLDVESVLEELRPAAQAQARVKRAESSWPRPAPATA